MTRRLERTTARRWQPSPRGFAPASYRLHENGKTLGAVYMHGRGAWRFTPTEEARAAGLDPTQARTLGEIKLLLKVR